MIFVPSFLEKLKNNISNMVEEDAFGKLSKERRSLGLRCKMQLDYQCLYLTKDSEFIFVKQVGATMNKTTRSVSSDQLGKSDPTLQAQTPSVPTLATTGLGLEGGRWASATRIGVCVCVWREGGG